MADHTGVISGTHPSGIERELRSDDVIVTKTDLKGRITYANDVFCRISALAETDVIGQPHSVIRHPEMPRAVFKLLWDSVQQDRELFAYVVNLAADGAHYWVLAHVTPSRDAHGRIVGYHSNRRRPAADAIARVRPLYQRLLAEEAHHRRAVDAANAGSAQLDQILAEQGTTYERYVWELTNAAEAA